jgi:imidazolonepropionase-like amidohydrolase
LLFATLFMLSASAGFAQVEGLPQNLFTNVHMFDGVNQKRIENASVLVEGNLIKNVSRDSIEAPGAKVIDGGGRTLMPGLIDSHIHLNLTELFASFVGAEYADWDGDAEPREEGHKTIRVIMKDGKFYKNTLE